MITALDRPLRRMIAVDGEPYVALLTPGGVRLTRKGRRRGVEVSWSDIVNGGVTLGSQLVESLQPGPAARRRRSE